MGEGLGVGEERLQIMTKKHNPYQQRYLQGQKPFAEYILKYAEAHDKATAEDYDALEQKIKNILLVMNLAYQKEDWHGR